LGFGYFKGEILSNSNSSRRWWVTGCIVVAILAAIWIKVRVEAGHSLEQAQQLESQGELELSIVCYRRTVRWYSPLSSPVKQSIEGLWAIGQEYEQKGDSRIALLAYRSIRSSLIGIRSVYQPYEAFISKSSERIAALMAQAEGTEAGSKEYEDRSAYHQALLLKDHAPNVLWSLLAVLAFLAWCFSLYGLSFHGFDDETGELITGKFGPRMGLMVVTLTTWIIALWQA